MENIHIIVTLGAFLIALVAANLLILNRLAARLEAIEDQAREYDVLLEVFGRYAQFYDTMVDTVKVISRFELPTDVTQQLKDYVEVTEKFKNLLNEVNKSNDGE
jgi:hypothetical protein